MRQLEYHLTVHSPFRPFEGHLIEMKTLGLVDIDEDLEKDLREHSTHFFKVFYFLSISTQILLAGFSWRLFASICSNTYRVSCNKIWT